MTTNAAKADAMEQLAIHGGPKAVREPILDYNSIGKEERDA